MNVKEEEHQPSITQDINDAFDQITMNTFEEYTKPPITTSSSSIPVKKEHPYKSKKNKYKSKK